MCYCVTDFVDFVDRITAAVVGSQVKAVIAAAVAGSRMKAVGTTANGINFGFAAIAGRRLG